MQKNWEHKVGWVWLVGHCNAYWWSFWLPVQATACVDYVQVHCGRIGENMFKWRASGESIATSDLDRFKKISGANICNLNTYICVQVV